VENAYGQQVQGLIILCNCILERNTKEEANKLNREIKTLKQLKYPLQKTET